MSTFWADWFFAFLGVCTAAVLCLLVVAAIGVVVMLFVQGDWAYGAGVAVAVLAVVSLVLVVAQRQP